MELMSLASMAMRQLGIYSPMLSLGIGPDSWSSPQVEWAIRLAVVGLFAFIFRTGRSKHGPWENIRMGKCIG